MRNFRDNKSKKKQTLGASFEVKQTGVKANRAARLFVYLSYDVPVAVTGSEVQRGVIATVHDVNTGAPHDEHVNNAAPALPARPVEGAESVVVTEKTVSHAFVYGTTRACVMSQCGGC